MFRRTRSRGGRGRRAAVDFVVRFGFGGVSCFFLSFFFFSLERTRPAASMRPPCLSYLSTSSGGCLFWGGVKALFFARSVGRFLVGSSSEFEGFFSLFWAAVKNRNSAFHLSYVRRCTPSFRSREESSFSYLIRPLSHTTSNCNSCI